jgi:hypothetical protein
VIDVLLPRGTSQAAVLGSFDAATGAFARVPFVSLEPAAVAAAAPAPAPAAPAAPAAPRLAVVDVAGQTVTVSGRLPGLAPLRLGEILGPDGTTPVARLVVVRILEDGFVGDVVDGAGAVRPGAAVRFPGPEGDRP